MDTSKEYIRMCEKAKEIQKEWNPKEADFVFGGENCKTLPIDSLPIVLYDLRDKLFLWLPRQDQLQEMVKGKFDVYCGAMLSRFMDWYNKNQMALLSMEQLWLAFVMKEKYSKVWDGKDWIK